MTGLTYRPEIDGLRAVSVIGVLLYHANLGVSGGYVGVDVFFVISGFLITSLILKDLRAERFSLIEFWERRIRRILPAMVAVLIPVLAIGYWLLLPKDLWDLARSAVAQVCMVSNVYFWQDTGYFSVSAELKPLLHTWSLAVEEQFYIALPVVMLLLFSWGRRSLFGLFATVAVLSLVISVDGVYRYPSATFYLLPTRAWELLIGGALAFTREKKIPRRCGEACSAVGIAAILSSMLFYTNQTPFPGLAACLPVGGAALVILGNQTCRTKSGRLLALQPIVFVGTISYSLYLWHWPLLAYGRYVYDAPLPPVVSAVLCVIAFALSVLSLLLVEAPVRRRRVLASRRAVFSFGISSLSLCFAVAIGICYAKGFAHRVASDLKPSPTRVMRADWEALRSGNLPLVGDDPAGTNPDFIVWGDSHAGVLLKLFDELGNEYGLSGVSAAHGGNPPLPGVRISWNKDLPEWNSRVMQEIRSKSIRHVFLVARWSNYIEGPSLYDLQQGASADRSLIFEQSSSARTPDIAAALLATRLSQLCEQLAEMECHVYLIAQCPEQNFDPLKREFISRRLGCSLAFPCSGTSIDQHLARQRRAAKSFARLRGEYVHVIDAAALMFDSEGKSITSQDGFLTYSDNHHLSQFGAEFALRRHMASVFERLREEAIKRSGSGG